ncbi:uncharacterized protein LOC141629138 [Silene latifolia]|uniref:uncharacterized protein LOC141629138 n=1 Tax=Silene latifolia TaxID=37657 RepID=UPI003D780DDC
MGKPELSGRMAKWSVHLSGYDLKFEPRTAIKSQALADFVSDFCPALQTQAEQDILNLEEDKGEQVWELHVDGASNAKGAGVGLVLKSPQGDLIVQAIRSRDPRMMAYLDVAKELKVKFVTFNIKQIPREQNVEADALATLGATFKTGNISTIPIVHVLEPATLKSQQEAEKVCSTSSEESTPDWRKPYLDWLQNDVLPADKKEVRGFKMKASRFLLIDNVLFRKSHAGPNLRCLDREESQAVLHDIHSGECGNHAGGRSLSNKVLRQGYFWPTMRKDAMEFAKRCDACQRHAHVSHQPGEPAHGLSHHGLS